MTDSENPNAPVKSAFTSTPSLTLYLLLSAALILLAVSLQHIAAITSFLRSTTLPDRWAVILGPWVVTVVAALSSWFGREAIRWHGDKCSLGEARQNHVAAFITVLTFGLALAWLASALAGLVSDIRHLPSATPAPPGTVTAFALVAFFCVRLAGECWNYASGAMSAPVAMLANLIDFQLQRLRRVVLSAVPTKSHH